MVSQTTALAQVFREALSADAMLAEPAAIVREYCRNVTALCRYVPLVLRPTSEDEVARIVALANQHRIGLYPFSTGKNWGLGSKLPVVDGCVLVDLSRMNQIVEVCEAFAYARIEPGVTQSQLAAYLQERHPGLTMNFTGSFGHTSIVGNVLERGDGAYARVHDLLGMRGIQGNGKPFQVGGLWNQAATDLPSHHAKRTAGPDLCGMFTHSSFGIVTQMAFRLIRKRERHYILWGVAPDAKLERLVDTFTYFAEQGVINRESVNIGYANRFVQATSTLGGTGGNSRDGEDPDQERVWNFYALVAATSRIADLIVEELLDALKSFCLSLGAHRTDANQDPYAALPAFLHPLVQPLMGVPDTESIKLIYQLTATPLPDDPSQLDVDQTPFGMKCYIAMLPPHGKYVRNATNIVKAVQAQFRLDVKLSIFGDGRALITVHFRSDDREQVRRAKRCEAALWDRMVAAGFPPYRASIDQMDRLIKLQPEFFDLVTQLKSVLDPNGVVAPGRYCQVGSGAPGAGSR